MDRIINFFPEERHSQLLQDLSLNMRGIISQRLIKTVDGKRAAAIEVLLGTPRAADLISKVDVSSLKELMEKPPNRVCRPLTWHFSNYSNREKLPWMTIQQQGKKQKKRKRQRLNRNLKHNLQVAALLPQNRLSRSQNQSQRLAACH
jgi:Tfp pilus assembly ATPase PilU